MTNPIIEGKWKGRDLRRVGEDGFGLLNKDQFIVKLDPISESVTSFEIVSDSRNVALGVKTAAIAGILTGGVGLLGGAAALKKKRLAVITWSDGEESLVEIRSAGLHKALVAASFKHRR